VLQQRGIDHTVQQYPGAILQEKYSLPAYKQDEGAWLCERSDMLRQGSEKQSDLKKGIPQPQSSHNAGSDTTEIYFQPISPRRPSFIYSTISQMLFQTFMDHV
jgi:hypothetical protein